LSAVELGRAAWSNAVGSQSLDRFLLDLLITDKIVEIV